MARKRRRIAVADCETDPFKKGRVDIKPFLWGFYDGEVYLEFKTVAEFIDYVSQLNIILYAHNGGKFDWFFILDYIEDFSSVTLINGRLAKFKIGNCEFRDSFNILPFRLADYKKTDIDYDIMEREERYKPENWREIRAYLKDDCLYLYDLVSAFVERFGVNLTIAGTAMKTWAKMAEMEPPRSTRAFYNNFKPYYYGGRVECFYHGIIDAPFEVVDIKSAYPFAMLHHHPFGVKYHVSDKLPRTIKYLERSFINLSAASLGAFPYRNGDNSLSFPDDGETRDFKITGWEYIEACENGCLKNERIKEVITFADSITFEDYINHFFNERAIAKSKGDKKTDLFCKLLMNSLYGKFGANPDEYEDFYITNSKFIQQAINDGGRLAGMLGNKAFIGIPQADAQKRFYNVATAASITGFVRAYLFAAIKASKHVLYCDTDSIAAIAPKVAKGDKLGLWESEGEFKGGAIGGKKLYCFEFKTPIKNGDETIKYKVRSKGVRLSAAEIISVAKGVPIKYEPIAPTFSLKRGIVLTPREVKRTIQKPSDTKPREIKF